MKIILSDSQQHAADTSFDWVPREFRKSAPKTWHQRRRHAAVRRLLQGLPGSVLDYGCGYGDIAYEVAKTNRVRGVDVDAPRVAFASAEYAPIPFTVNNGERLDFSDDCFDVVLSVVVIHFAADPLAYLREARRVLRPGGHLAIICRQQSVIDRGLRRLLGVQPRQVANWVAPDGQSRPLWIPARSELISLLVRDGFRLVRKDHFYDPPTEIGSWKEWPQRIAEQVLSVFGVSVTANYFALLLRKD